MARDQVGQPLPSVADRLIDASIALLAQQGPSALKARTVAAACGLSTMVVYSHFGGVPELVAATADRGFERLGRVFDGVEVGDDAVCDLFLLAVACRTFARENPHLYDLMFGLSVRATYRPTPRTAEMLDARSPAFRSVYRHVADASERLVGSGRIDQVEPNVVAAQLWSFVHGMIGLELGGHLAEFPDPVVELLVPMGVAFCTGMGDAPERARASHESGLRALMNAGDRVPGH